MHKALKLKHRMNHITDDVYTHILPFIPHDRIKF